MRYVFFDLDGTLTDSQLGITRCLQHALTALGRAPLDQGELRGLIGAPLHKAFAHLLGADSEELIPAAVDHYRERYRQIGIFENEVYPGVAQMLDAVRLSDWQAFVVTSKPRVYAEQIIEHFALGQHFSAIHGSELDGTNTEKTDLIRHVLDTEQIAANEVVMIGDRRHDLLGAKANQVASIGVLWGYGSVEELSACDPKQLIAGPDELLPAIGQLR